MIRRVARQASPETGIFRIVLRQAFYEHWVLFSRRIQFRFNDNGAAVMGYLRMETKIFEGVNARQNWSNWRTIPRNLSRNIPARPLFVVDLCCGTGQSSEVLAHYLPEGSEILGLEFNPRFVEKARERTYRHGGGSEIRSCFHQQSVLETFKYPDGNRVADDSVDVVNSCGAVGHHFRPEETRKLAEEVSRVLKPGAIALIDSGERGTPKRRLINIMREVGLEPVRSARSCFFDSFEQVCFRKKS